ncbi:MAG: alanine racemase [Spirochaetia bacterium]|nr:alanine racemase [Spirochaetia bacterium]
MQTWLEISASALKENLQSFQRATGGPVMAVVKSNAYGHGIEQTVGALRGFADWFGVNSIEEAVRVRQIDAETPLLVMGANDVESYLHLREMKHRPELVLSSIDAIESLQARAPGTKFHLKVDTGMSRLGFHGATFDAVLEYLALHPELPWAGLMTHFANVEDVTDQQYAQKQLDYFAIAKAKALKAAGNRPLLFHSAASGAALILPSARMDIVRVGISLYGMWPSRETRISARSMPGADLPADFDLVPALTWKTRIVHINSVSAGTPIGYGCTHRPVQDTRVAVLPVGYFEGYDRRLSNKSHVLVLGCRAPLLGRVCMNMIMVDITHIPGATVQTEAVLIGTSGSETVSADDLAGLSDTINYQVTTAIQSQLPRVLVRDST